MEKKNNIEYLNTSNSYNDEIIRLLKDLAFPHEYLIPFDRAIIKSSLASDAAAEQISNIVKEFNLGRKTIMSQSSLGTRIEPDEFRLVSLNNKPELVPPSKDPYRKQIFVFPNKTKELGNHKQTKLFFGAYGSYVVNVPIGKIALAWKGNVPIMLGTGPHVIHDPNMRKISEENLVDISTSYIKHGTYHILRVPQGHVAKILIKNTPYFLVPSSEPYIFNEPVIEFEKDLTKLTSGYIAHGNYHIIQVPNNKVAKIWIGSQAYILEADNKPYVYNNPSFRLEPKNENENFESATERVIIHGSIKRLMPRTGEVAITFDNGRLETYGASIDNEPTMITSANHSFEGFLTINTQTIEFPSQRTRESRHNDAIKAKTTETIHDDINFNDINYEVFRTSDGLPIGVKLLVVFEITDPKITLSKLNQDQIISHIENLVVADMGMVIQSCNSVDFLKSNQTQIKSLKNNELDHSAAEFYEHLQDRVKNQLGDDFAKYGIKLVRLNIETPKVLDPTISSKMAEFSLMSTEARAKESVLEKNFIIAKQQATQKATEKQIGQNQENENKISQAKADFEATKLSANADLEKRMVDIKIKQIELELAEKKALLFEKYPSLLQFELTKLQMEAVGKIKTMLITDQMAKNIYGLNFGPGMGSNFVPNVCQSLCESPQETKNNLLKQ